MHCVYCEELLAPSARFCSQCGKPVAAVIDGPVPSVRSPASDASSPTRAGSQAGTAAIPDWLRAERRFVTVMFCDLVGSTALSTQLDPEDLSQLLVQYRAICMQATQRWDGLVASFAGDGVMIYFGYPTAHEDDPQRAVLAAHAIIDGVQTFNRQKEHTVARLSVRIGISSGLVVIGDIGSGDILQNRGVVGEAPNVAAKVQGWAQPGKVVVSADTFSQLQDVFPCRALGEFALAGVAQPVNLYEVGHTSVSAERFQRLRQRGLTPVVGRHAEQQALLQAWEDVHTGKLVSFGLAGDAGVGKSRLTWALREHLKALRDQKRLQRMLVLNCSPHHSTTAWHPWLDAFADRFTARPARAHYRLDRVLRRHTDMDGRWLEADIDALAALLADEPLHRAETGASSNRVRSALLRFIVGLARRKPLLVLVEDAHWIDPSTADCLQRLLKDHPTERILLLATSRRMRTLEEIGIEQRIALGALSRSQARELMRAALEGCTLPESWLDRMMIASDGNPLHIEELVRHVRETQPWRALETSESSGGFDDGSVWMPMSLQALFMSRLDRQHTGKALLQTAAVLGRRFSADVLRRLTGEPTDRLVATLERLRDVGLVYQVGDANRQDYEFQHALLRDAAYQSLLVKDRRRLHRSVTEALLEEDPRSLETRPELLAFHYTRGGERRQAIEAWRRAGIRAQRLSANTEAVEHFQQALNLAGKGDDATAHEHRLSLLVRQGPSMMAIRSWASVDVERLYHEIIGLSRRLDDKSRLFVGYRGLWGTAMLRGQMLDAVAIAGTLSLLARELDNPALALEARMCHGANHFWRGDMRECERRMRLVMREYDPELHHRHAYRFSVDPGVLSRFYLGIVSWYRGDAEAAWRLVKHAVALAHEHSHYPSLAWAFGFHGWLAILRGDPDEAHRIALQSERLCRAHDLPLYGAWARVIAGAAEMLGKPHRGALERLQEGIDTYRRVGAGVALPVFLNLRARGLVAIGDATSAKTTLDEARQVSRELGLGVVTADCWHVQAAAEGIDPGASSLRQWRCLKLALEIALRQGKDAIRCQVIEDATRLASTARQLNELAEWQQRVRIDQLAGREQPESASS